MAPNDNLCCIYLVYKEIKSAIFLPKAVYSATNKAKQT
jgi:hypothetical protein